MISWPMVCVAVCVCALIGWLSWIHYVPYEVVGMFLAGIIGWLVPSPLPKKQETPTNG